MSLVLRVLLIDQPALVINTDLVDLSPEDAWRLALGVVLKTQSHMNVAIHLWDPDTGLEWKLEGGRVDRGAVRKPPAEGGG